MFWRAVDLRYGAFEMFEHPNFTGIRTTVFLAEWAPNVKHFIVGWHMNDSMTSLKWQGLPDRLSIKLFEHPDGGRSFDRALGWSSMKEAGYLPDHDFNDNVSAFEWYLVIPHKEIIQPVTINIDTSAGSEGISNELSQVNKTGSEQKMTLTAEKSISETLTVSTSETHSLIPPTKIETKATRWYSEAIAGAERDDSNPKAIWKREETVYITVSGGVASATVADVEFFAGQY